MKIVIVGAGFSGAATAIEYLKGASVDDELIIINQTGKMARGVAYGTNSPSHYLNVPAGNMSASASVPNSFVDYCRSRNLNVASSSFVQRKIYGEYLESQLEKAEHESLATMKRVVGEVVRLYHRGNEVTVTLENGKELQAKHVVLAFGNFAPRTPKNFLNLLESSAFFNDPWQDIPDSWDSRRPRVLIIGSGLTAVDATLKIINKCPDAKCTLLSRRGLTPQAHRKSVPLTPYDGTVANMLLTAHPTIRNYVKILRNEIAQSPDRWRDIITALRPVTFQLWQRLNLDERRRFLRHVQPYWDTHRHRLAPKTALFFEFLLQSGRVKIFKGRAVAATQQQHHLEASLIQRGRVNAVIKKFDLVVNCTGPCMDLKTIDSPLINGLIENGIITSDNLRLGIMVDEQYATINSSGKANSWLTYVGPMLRATYWEATAVPDLRQHAYAVAAKLIQLNAIAIDD